MSAGVARRRNYMGEPWQRLLRHEDLDPRCLKTKIFNEVLSPADPAHCSFFLAGRTPAGAEGQVLGGETDGRWGGGMGSRASKKKGGRTGPGSLGGLMSACPCGLKAGAERGRDEETEGGDLEKEAHSQAESGPPGCQSCQACQACWGFGQSP